MTVNPEHNVPMIDKSAPPRNISARRNLGDPNVNPLLKVHTRTAEFPMMKRTGLCRKSQTVPLALGKVVKTQ